MEIPASRSEPNSRLRSSSAVHRRREHLRARAWLVAEVELRRCSCEKRNAEEDGIKNAQENDPRVTRIGRFLRKTRLDETPQFWSVLRGEMSLVGPRAERPELVAEYQKQIPFYRARLLVKPGLTGWAQINYGYVATIKETVVKLEYDLYYIKHRTLSMDFNIVLRTIGTVLRRTGR